VAAVALEAAVAVVVAVVLGCRSVLLVLVARKSVH
jgi:hypothetical protein